jgi:hypothetical protein
MAERKKLSNDVMQQFLKNPGKAAAKADDMPEITASPTEQSDLTASVLAEFKKPNPERKVRITVDLYASRHKRLKAISGDLDTDMSTLVRTLIDKFIDEVDSQ